MTDVPYSNREIDSHFKEIKDTLARIESQTTKTNGRVDNLENWRSYTAGAIAVIILIGVLIVGFLITKVLEFSQ